MAVSLRQSAIDRQTHTRNCWNDLTPVIQKYSDLRAIGLSEDITIVAKGDIFEVLRAWKIAIHDNTLLYQPWEQSFYVFSSNDVYSMKTR